MKKPQILLIIIFLFISYQKIFPQVTEIFGTVKDSETGEALIGTNVFLKGTAFGAATDFDGNYSIKNVPLGHYTIVASFIGYKPVSKEIDLQRGKKLKLNFNLIPESLEGEEIVITAQALGQKQAINQQLASTNIKNIVSSAKIQEIPDANAAESVGRLPGVSILREGGEGNKVVIRGLEPKFSSVTINGVTLSSSDNNNRGSDLSMISSNMLDGIEVSKSITPDMDANTIGGVVNFKLRDASSSDLGKPKFSLSTQGAYNGLSNAQSKFNNYKIDGTFESRFLENDLGLFLQASFENRNLSSNELGVQYNPEGNSKENYLIGNITLDDIYRIKTRANAVFSIDYNLGEGKIKLTNFFSNSGTDIEDRRQFYNVNRGTNTQEFISNKSKQSLNTISNILDFEKKLLSFDTYISISHSYSETDRPRDWTVSFINSTAGIENFGFASNVDPVDVVRQANNDLANTLLKTVQAQESFASERTYSFKLDLEKQFNISNKLNAKLKFGGKYDYKKRFYDLKVTDGQAFGFASGAEIIEQLVQNLSWFNHTPGDNLNVPMNQFIDQDFETGEFLDGKYDIVYPMNFDLLDEMVNFMYNNQIENNITFNNNVGSSITNDYSGIEDISAAYFMATFDYGQWLTVIPGIRYQQLRTEYTAPQGIQGPLSFSEYPFREKTVVTYNPYWLPALLINIKPTNWFDIRLAYTNTLSYQDYVSLAPRINVAQSAGILQYNGFNLKPIESTNYDVYLSFYNNTIGLFTVGAFFKQIENITYAYNFHPSADDLIQYYPDWVDNKQPIGGITVSKYINNPYQVENFGMEFDWQTHFWYLPEVLSGLILNINYTHIFSEAEYPFEIILRDGRRTVYVDSSYIAPLLYQPDNILNITLGYDYKDFSMRLSALYTDKIFSEPNFWEQLRAYTDAYTRWDLSVKQKLPMLMKGLEVYINYNNITGAKDASSISAKTSVPRRIQAYDSMVEFGFRSKF